MPLRARTAETAAAIDWLSLTEKAQWTLREIEVRIWAGYSSREVAERVGLSVASVGQRRAELRREIRDQVGGDDS